MRLLAVALLVLVSLLLGGSGNRSPVAPSEPISLVALLDGAALDLLRQSPEAVTARGLSARLGMRNDFLDGVALDTTGEGYAPIEAALAAIRTADVASLSPQDRRAVATFESWLRDAVDGRPYQTYACPVSTYLSSVPQHVAWFMEYVHPLATLDDAEDYMSRLSQIPVRFAELVPRLAAVEEAGALAPRHVLARASDEIESLGRGPFDTSPFYRRFAAALQAIPGISDEVRRDLLARAAKQVSAEVLPAYAALAKTVREFAERGSADVGVWRLDGGPEYYRYLLRMHTTTDMTAEEVHSFGLREVERLQEEIRAAVADLGYDADLPLPLLFARVGADAGMVSGDATVGASRELIGDAARLARDAFLDWPTGLPTVEPGGPIAYFAEGTEDGTRPGVFFAPVDQIRPTYSLPSLVYHETVPGHFLQMASARMASRPDFLGGVSFSGYAEGWATYAERLAWELGAYARDPLGNIGRLQEELLRAVRLVVDPGIHAFRWTYEEAVRYMIEATGLSETTVRDEVDRYIVAPGQATAYGVGLHKFLELRERTRDALGPAFDLAEFHRAVLSCGGVPFSILQEVIDHWIDDRLSGIPRL